MRLHVVDGTYELYRAHFSKRPPHRAPDGSDAKATVGVVSSLLALLADPDEAVTHLAVAFDNPIRSFRNDLFAGYKSDAGVPPELRAQFDAVEDAVRALGVVVWSMDTFEADDAMATAARRFAATEAETAPATAAGDATGKAAEVRLMTPDKDLAQCLRAGRVVQVDRRQLKLTTEERFLAARGFSPRSVPDFLALTGDAADGIPGLPGFGEKSAAAVLGAYGHLEAIPEHGSAWSVRPRGFMQLAATLGARRGEALLYRRLATLVETVPLRESLEDLRHRGVPRGAFEGWCDRLGARTLRTAPRSGWA